MEILLLMPKGPLQTPSIWPTRSTSSSIIEREIWKSSPLDEFGTESLIPAAILKSILGCVFKVTEIGSVDIPRPR